MSTYLISRYAKHENYAFEQLPKGEMLGISMNPYNGNVYFQLEKHKSSSVIALDMMREIVHACELLERLDATDPLRDYLEYCESGVIVEKLVEAARARKADFRKGNNTKYLVMASKVDRKTA